MSPRINPLGARGCEFGNVVHAGTRVQSNGRGVGAVRFQAASPRLPVLDSVRLRPVSQERRPVASYGRRPGVAEDRLPGFHLRVLRRLARPHGIRNRVSGRGLLAVSVVGEGDPRIAGSAVVFVRAGAGCARSVRDARVGGPVIRDTKAGEGGVAQRAGVGKLRAVRRGRLAHPCSAGDRRGVPGGDVRLQGDEAVNYGAGEVGGVALGLDGAGDGQQARGEGLREIITTRQPACEGQNPGGVNICARPP